MPTEVRHSFETALEEHHLDLTPLALTTLQVNTGKFCNQACHHCHVDASPYRTEAMDRRTADQCLTILGTHAAITTLDITGGAPELNPHFEHLVIEARRLGKRVMVRHNLTVTLDGNPRTNESKGHLPAFFAAHQVEVVSSLPYYQEYFTDKQRGKGVFAKSIDSLKLLNAQGYGKDGSALVLDLVYNPVGAFLPAAQASLEAEFKRHLTQLGVSFNALFTITNMPIHRFRAQLERLGAYDAYMSKLTAAFNPAAAESVMCRSLISVGYDGRLYDCDFNQMLEMQIDTGEPMTVFNFDWDQLAKRRIRFASHCFGCTAGAGSSCGGATTS